MKNDVSLRLKRSRSWLFVAIPIVYSIALVAGLAALGVRNIRWLWDFDSILGPWFAIFTLLILLSSLVLSLAMLAYTAVFMWKHRLVFGPTHMERLGVPFPWMPRGRIAYEDVGSIRAIGRSVLAIVPSRGKTWFIGIKAYETGSEVILPELRARVAPDRFQLDLERALTVPARMDRRSVALLVGAFVLVAASWAVTLLVEPVRALGGWTRAVRLPFSSRIEAFDLGPDGSLWLLLKDGLGDWAETSNYRVRHVAAAAEETWRLPSNAELFPEEGVTREHLRSIHLDSAGRPCLGFLPESRLLCQEGSRWQWFVYAEEGMDLGPEDPVWTDGVLWTQDMRTSDLYSFNVVTALSETYTLGPEEYEAYHHLRPTADGALLVLAGGRHGRWPTALNRYAEGEWSGWTDIDFGEVQPPEAWTVSDFTSDPLGNLYVLVRSLDTSCVDGVVTSLVGRWEVAAERWDWRELRLSGNCEDYQYYYLNPFLVDPRGRLWMETRNAVVVFLESPFEVPAGTPIPTTTYSEDNSGYTGRGTLSVTADGRVWALGSDGHLVWIDAGAPVLPKPLPRWIERAIAFPGMYFILAIPGLGLLLWCYLRERRILDRRLKAPFERGSAAE
jgi:hypothetical protein